MNNSECETSKQTDHIQPQAEEDAALRQLDAQIEEDQGLDEPALEALRVRRRQKAKKIADTNGRLAVRAGLACFVLTPGLSESMNNLDPGQTKTHRGWLCKKTADFNELSRRI